MLLAANILVMTAIDNGMQRYQEEQIDDKAYTKTPYTQARASAVECRIALGYRDGVDSIPRTMPFASRPPSLIANLELSSH